MAGTVVVVDWMRSLESLLMGVRMRAEVQTTEPVLLVVILRR